MHSVNQAVSVLPGGVPSPTRRQPPILAAYEHFRLDRQGMLVSPRMLEYHDGMVLPFLRWAEADGLERFTQPTGGTGMLDDACLLRSSSENEGAGPSYKALGRCEHKGCWV
jgi:hypothetical protein